MMHPSQRDAEMEDTEEDDEFPPGKNRTILYVEIFTHYDKQ